MAPTLTERYEFEAAHRGIRMEDLPAEDRAAMAAEVLATQFPGWVPTCPSTGAPVEVVPYDAAWPPRFATWRDRLAAALVDTAVRVEHVGSTAVPGLPAKPVIDIQVSVPYVGDESAYVPAIESVGVPLQSRDAVHRFFRPPPRAAREVHIHVCAAASAWESEQLLFRDYLLAHPATRDAYAALKHELAQRWRDDRIAYTEAKTGFILDVLDSAERCGRAAGSDHCGCRKPIG